MQGNLDNDTAHQRPHTQNNTVTRGNISGAMEQDQLLLAASCQKILILEPSPRLQAIMQVIQSIQGAAKQPVNCQQMETLLTNVNTNLKQSPVQQSQARDAHLALFPVSTDTARLTKRSIRGDPTKPLIRLPSPQLALGEGSDEDTSLLSPDITERTQTAINANRAPRVPLTEQVKANGKAALASLLARANGEPATRSTPRAHGPSRRPCHSSPQL